METTPEDKKKASIKEYKRQWAIKNKEHIKEQKKKYYAENSEAFKKYYTENLESIKKQQKKYQVENSESIKKQKKIYYAENSDRFINQQKKYYAENSESIKEYQKKYKNNRLKTDPIFRMRENMRRRLTTFFKSSNTKKTNKTAVYVGCTNECFVAHLIKQFKEGMTLESYGYRGWHIDHIIPLASAKSEEDIKKLCHYTNLQPLWWWENLSKGNKYDKR